ncbi:MAG TPA: hypothetical protein VGO86_15615 [Candidatus Dormibacteraeota bacterium]
MARKSNEPLAAALDDFRSNRVDPVSVTDTVAVPESVAATACLTAARASGEAGPNVGDGTGATGAAVAAGRPPASPHAHTSRTPAVASAAGVSRRRRDDPGRRPAGAPAR